LYVHPFPFPFAYPLLVVLEGGRTTFQLEIRRMIEKTQSRLFTVQEAARYLAVSASTLYGWVWQRRISFVKVGRALRFDVRDLERFIDENREAASQEKVGFK
jgi:excisionase family DNA binding protein